MNNTNMINAIEWFKAKGFTFDDKITIRDVIILQHDAKESGIELATDLYQSACSVMRNRDNENSWHNLQNAAARWDAARQAARNDAIASNDKVQRPLADSDAGRKENRE